MTNSDNKMVLEKRMVDIELHLNEYDNGAMSDFQKEFLREELATLPEIEEGEVSINGIYTFDMGEKIEVSVYLRNGLSNQINFDKIPLEIVNKNGEIIAKQTIDMSDFGILPPFSARPYKVYFDKTNLVVGAISNDDFVVRFEESMSAINTVVVELEDMAEDIDYDLKSSFTKFLDKLPLIKAGDVSIEVFKTLRGMDNTISVVFMIRNGCDKNIKLERLPIVVKDEKNQVVAKGVFEVENVSVNPHKAKVYDFTITKDHIINQDFDITKCSVYFKSE